MLGVLVMAAAGLAWYGGRLAGSFWPLRADPEVGPAFWLVAAFLALLLFSVAWIVVLLHDLVMVTIEVSDEGLAVDRWRRPFRARWDEVREIGLVTRLGELTVRSARDSVTTTARLLGPDRFAVLVGALRSRAGVTLREWTAWHAARRHLVTHGGPVLAMALIAGLLSVAVWLTAPRGRR